MKPWSVHVVWWQKPDMPADELEKLANAVGIWCGRCCGVSKNRTTAHIFDWDNMLALRVIPRHHAVCLHACMFRVP
ncbi:hypothetical protein ACNKHM_24615 [Shigella sonnei]